MCAHACLHACTPVCAHAPLCVQVHACVHACVRKCLWAESNRLQQALQNAGISLVTPTGWPGLHLPLVIYLLLGLHLHCFLFLLPELSMFLIFLYRKRFALPSEMINCLRTKALLYLVCDCESVPEQLLQIFVQTIPDSPVTAPLLLRCGSWSKPGHV